MNLETPAKSLKDYKLLDSGEGMKLEEIAGVRVQRPSPQAIWSRRLKSDEWLKATSICSRSKEGGGQWQHLKALPKNQSLHYQGLSAKLKFTNFGHCGVFFEQVPVWNFLSLQVQELKLKLKRAPRVANLFGYTGFASLAMAQAGAEVYHVDSAKGAIDWARENMEISKLSDIKFYQEDVQKFLISSYNKSLRFDGILADPPSWGHGAKKEVWEFEKHISSFIDKVHAVLNSQNSFLFLSSHTHGVQAEALKNLLAQDKRWKSIKCGELGVAHESDSRILPAGIYASGLC